VIKVGKVSVFQYLAKTDIYIINEDIKIQYKSQKNVMIHNWPTEEQIMYINRHLNIDIRNKMAKILLSKEENLTNRLIKYKKTRLPDSKLMFFSMNVKIVDKITENHKNLVIEDIKEKEIYLRWNFDGKNNFYYIVGDEYDNMNLLTHEYIKKLNLVYDPRPIYYNPDKPSKTQLKHKNIFKDVKEINDLIDRINNTNSL
jgi:hypothetical protein